MITIEFDEDETFINIMDETAELEDVGAILYDDYCHIRQFDEKAQRYNIITMTSVMYLKLMNAWSLPEGAYKLDYESKMNE